MMTTKSEPLSNGGRLFYGLLYFDSAGRIADIDIIIDNVRFSKDNDPDWVRTNFDFTFQDILRYRDIVRLRYKDRLTKDFS